MIKTAVILGAGLGSRLGELNKNKPKGFLEIDQISIIEMSINKLLQAGIDKIFIGTGYQSQLYEQLALKYPQIKCIYNENYKITGSMCTLYNLRDYVLEDFILLESDLLYDIAGLQILIHHNMTDVILASELSSSRDEVFIETDLNNSLINMSKNIEKLGPVDCELVGISKLSYETFKDMCDYAETFFESNPGLDYEYVLVGIAKEKGIHVNKIKDYTWCEIDDEKHLHRAINEIYPKIKSQEIIRKPLKRNILLNPGPATTTDSVKNAQVVPDICPREKEFGHVMQFISTELTCFVGNAENFTAVLFGGSGTAAIESILSSVIGQDYVIIINNGAYGKRMCEIAQVYGMNYIEFESPFGEAADLIKLEEVIQQSPFKISHLAIVHHETTTGLLNDIASVGSLCQKYNIDFIVDAVSSYAAVPIDMFNMNIDYLASTSNKNLQGTAGVSFVIARNDKLENIKHIKARNFYLDLYSQYKYFIENGQTRFTPPVQTLYALKQAIIETQNEGINKRYDRYSRLWHVLVRRLNEFGLTHLVKEENHSKLITAVIEPECKLYNFNNMYDYFYGNGITIYPGKINTLNTFRIANIGDITMENMVLYLDFMEQYLKNISFL